MMLEDSTTAPSVITRDQFSLLHNSMFLAQTTQPFFLPGIVWPQEEPLSFSNDVTTDAINDDTFLDGGKIQNQEESAMLSSLCTHQDFSDVLSIWIEDTGCMTSYIQICERKIDQLDRFW